MRSQHGDKTLYFALYLIPWRLSPLIDSPAPSQGRSPTSCLMSAGFIYLWRRLAAVCGASDIGMWEKRSCSHLAHALMCHCGAPERSAMKLAGSSLMNAAR